MIYEILFRVSGYIAFGLVLEIIFTGLSRIIDGKISGNDKELQGNVSLWMIPVYALIFAVYEPVFQAMYYINTPIPVRFIWWAILISGVEAFFGYAYDRFLKIRPWDYSTCEDKVFKNGYTRYYYVPLWGAVGIILECYVQVLQGLSPYVQDAIKAIKFIWL